MFITILIAVCAFYFVWLVADSLSDDEEPKGSDFDLGLKVGYYMAASPQQGNVERERELSQDERVLEWLSLQKDKVVN